MSRSYLIDKIIKTMLAGIASMAILVVLLIFLFLGKEAVPFLGEHGLAPLFEKHWIPVSFVKETYGFLPLLAGSFLVTGLALLFSVPPGILTAVYLAEMAEARERAILKPFIELLAGIPSVVIGFFGLVVLGPIIKDVFNLSSGLTACTGACLLALMAMPTIISVSEDAIRNVPRVYREASLAVGANPVQTIFKVTVPAALPGITAAVMLGIGRVIGETMTVMMVTGNAPLITFSPFESVRTMTATIAAEMGEVAFGSMHYSALFGVGLVLLAITVGINLISQIVLRKGLNK